MKSVTGAKFSNDELETIKYLKQVLNAVMNDEICESDVIT